MLKELSLLIKERFPIGILGIFSFSYIGGMLNYLHIEHNHYTEWMLLTIGTVLFLFFLRCIDEVRDYEYDQLFHAERPVARGAISLIHMKYFGLATLLVFLLLFGKSYTVVPLILLTLFVIAMSRQFWLKSLMERKDLIFVLLHNTVFIFVSILFISFLLRRLWFPTTVSDVLFLLILQIPVFILEVGRKLEHRLSTEGLETDDTYAFRWGEKNVALALNSSIICAGVLIFLISKPIGIAWVLVSIIMQIPGLYKIKIPSNPALVIYFLIAVLIPLSV
ncbi:hypothetical protein CO112_01435 [Candidatus Dojkabacteria bacterium CG_4_9_14_3_um_filter_150_Dojkabacteria_WS6_41_13]|uniref:Prenyltransferase n=1 Tax=Candidatus Dojkabacteria bacterium CG_4_10_14_0_2_um_filter_Dojkabacteria_WS6_41_15 TaxID=2014249 RepID=A0A2M7W1M6_9BACT|nr:MAG: hypothetical protein COZ14_00575 [Candidatus Dojkabacteria bacterium CG_4_10_14_3_um_filter_Dojkabacteria_WS6_41_9]PJA13659.1 MAG: hypothetical protein COX64_03055 [Candidatus Dojkabacteria bacterium CG_4_10_14_0_2_um_filter_Dojkabacteria_WS6_41_15]PJB23113.1 MAG: hypothetical protein CO112_01435 [Candidatus Dojkabacteria bacterium CG_4_9_14_3_um_filter_150_Dojkabacteria_WS6_41_13]